MVKSPKIVFEDSSILILDKPSGWIVNSAGTTTTQPVVQAWLKENFDYPISKDDDYRSGIVHRLDKETSGILLIAKTKESFEKLQRQFKDRIVKKTYTALVHGEVKQEEGEINATVGRLPWRRDRFGVLQGGRDAVTKYKVVKIYKKGQEEYTLLKLFPETGRTHQIRIHLKYINHPVVSDQFYAGRKTARKDRVWCPRIFLHASLISFIHPETKKQVSFESDLFSDLDVVLSHLKKGSG